MQTKIVFNNKILTDNPISYALNRAKDIVAIVYFPEAFTTTCTNEMPRIAALMDFFNEYKVQVLGVSPDKAAKLLRWTQTPVESGGVGNLPFPLVSDEGNVFTEYLGIVPLLQRSKRFNFVTSYVIVDGKPQVKEFGSLNMVHNKQARYDRGLLFDAISMRKRLLSGDKCDSEMLNGILSEIEAVERDYMNIGNPEAVEKPQIVVGDE